MLFSMSNHVLFRLFLKLCFLTLFVLVLGNSPSKASREQRTSKQDKDVTTSVKKTRESQLSIAMVLIKSAILKVCVTGQYLWVVPDLPDWRARFPNRFCISPATANGKRRQLVPTASYLSKRMKRRMKTRYYLQIAQTVY